MTRMAILAAAAAMAIGGVQLSSFAQQTDSNAADQAAQGVDQAAEDAGQAVDNAADTMQDSAQRAADQVAGAAGELTLPAGIQLSTEADDSEGIRDTLASTTEAALTNGGFNDLVERLVDADRNRIGDLSDEELSQLNGRIDQIAKAWETKYSEKFDITDEAAVFDSSVAIVQGEVQDPSLVRGNWPVQPVADSEGGDMAAGQASGEETNPAETAAGRDEASGTDAMTGGDTNLDQGRNVALARIPDSHDLPAVTVSLIHEMPDSWRIDIPDNISGQQLRDNLLADLTKIGEQSASWPSDKNEAYRQVSHCILLAVLGANAEEGAQAGYEQEQQDQQQGQDQQQQQPAGGMQQQ